MVLQPLIIRVISSGCTPRVTVTSINCTCSFWWVTFHCSHPERILSFSWLSIFSFHGLHVCLSHCWVLAQMSPSQRSLFSYLKFQTPFITNSPYSSSSSSDLLFMLTYCFLTDWLHIYLVGEGSHPHWMISNPHWMINSRILICCVH